MSRRVWFIVAVLAGITLGLVYGWLINPVKHVETSPDTLRADYKTDYILMVAEAYRAEGDLTQAVRRLAILGNTPPLGMVQQAIVIAGQSGFSPKDVDLMLKLSQGLKTWSPETKGTQ
jgi:hypothetical protein